VLKLGRKGSSSGLFLRTDSISLHLESILRHLRRRQSLGSRFRRCQWVIWRRELHFWYLPVDQGSSVDFISRHSLTVDSDFAAN
jgi:hypothetical protein